MKQKPARCLILACGNTLRMDDGIGPFLAAWAEERFAGEPGLQVAASQQWTPELAEDLAAAHTALFLDCTIDTVPGSVALTSVTAAAEVPRLLTHHLDASGLLAVVRDYYCAELRECLLLTVGAGSLELGEGFSTAVEAALPEAQMLLEEAVLMLLGGEKQGQLRAFSEYT